MNLSRNWLKEFTQITATDHDFAEAMTLSGTKVETTETPMEELKNIVVGQVISMKPHENSDHMFVCQVDVKKETLQIVTGAQNLKEGDLVPMALPDSVVAGGKEIKAGELRGVPSNGMLCSLGELGLDLRDFPDAVEDGIWVITEEDAVIGEDIRVIAGLNDRVVEFEITPNRVDCYSVIGLAREVAATYNTPLTLHEPEVKATCTDNLLELVDVEISTLEDSACPRYTARMVRNVKIAPSPRWMRERLRSCGVRPINNIVDITNYVMLEYGQPMHAFDYRYVKDGKIIVRGTTQGETVTTLDGVERHPPTGTLVIADGTKALGLAGIMGGENSGIEEDTVDVVFESANFDSKLIREATAFLGMRTDASALFEKELSPLTTLPAVNRACELVELLGAGDVVEGVIDELRYVAHAVTVPFDGTKINKLLGTDLSDKTQLELLERVGFTHEKGVISVPNWRQDVFHYSDLAEEVARFYGYNNIPTTLMRGDTTQGGFSPEEQVERHLGTLCRGMGYSEIITYSFISPTYLDKIRMSPEDSRRNAMKILNPLGEDTSIMRTTVLPSMLDILARNYNYRNPEARFYELGRTYFQKEDGLAYEPKTLSMGAFGGEMDFFALKGSVEALLQALRVEKVTFQPEGENPSYHGGRCAKVLANGKELGVLGQIHPLVAKNYGVDQELYCAELSLEGLIAQSGGVPQYVPLPKFPPMTRDIALVCDQSTTVGALQECIEEGGSALLREVSLFDIYQGKGVAEGKKSVAFNLVLRSDTGSLTAPEADQEIANILKLLETKCSAVLR